MTKWLVDHGVKVHLNTVARALEKVRAAAPLPPEPAPDLEPATDEDELLTVRRFARKQMNEGEGWKAQQGGAALLLRVIELRRKKQTAQPAEAAGQVGVVQGTAPAPVIAPEQPQLTAEQEAELVRQQLGKRPLN